MGHLHDEFGVGPHGEEVAVFREEVHVRVSIDHVHHEHRRLSLDDRIDRGSLLLQNNTCFFNFPHLNWIEGCGAW